jgi:undecaprenyl-diphosphatase
MVNPVKSYQGGNYSFVSSHATNSFGMAIFTSLLFRNKFYTVFIFTGFILIVYTRIYLGVHFPGDVIGGMLLGLLIAYVTHPLMQCFIFWPSVPSLSSKNRKIKLSYAGVVLLSRNSFGRHFKPFLVIEKLFKYGIF